MSSDPNYELIARVWRDSTTSDDSVWIEVIDGELHLTVMTDHPVSVAVVLPSERIRELRNALARAEKRLS